MKLSKEELKQKINELELSDDTKISLLEDIEDSVDVVEEDSEEKVLKSEYDAVVLERDEIKRKYKERFLSPEEVPQDEELEEIEEEKIVDVKEI